MEKFKFNFHTKCILLTDFALDKENYIIYSCTKYREAKHEVAINFNDKDLNIKWPQVKKNCLKKR